MGERTHTEELLAPGADALSRAFELLDAAKTVLLVVAVVGLLVVGGAKLERYLMKRRLEVLDGAAQGGDVDLTEGRGGDRR